MGRKMTIKKVKITPELVEALRMLKADKNWTDYRLSKEVNTTPTSVFRWMNYKASHIGNATVPLLMPILQPYLDKVMKKKKAKGPKIIPHYIKNVCSRLEALADRDPDQLKAFCDMLEGNIAYAESTMDKVYSDKSKPAKIKLKKLSKKESKLKQEENFYTPLDEMETIEAAAGTGCIYDYEYSVANLPKRNDFDVINVNGNSMEPYIKEGSRIVVQRFSEPIDFGELYLPEESVKELVPDGSIVIYNLNDSGLAIKKVRYESHERDGGPEWSLYLDALNDEWAGEHDFPKRITMQDRLLIYGKMIGQAG